MRGDDERIFDVVIIGSGPAAIAALDGIAGVEKIAVVSGAVPESMTPRRLHAKIQAVAAERAEQAGVAEPLTFADKHWKPLTSTAAVGGLANYWGQQAVRFGPDDPWPRDVFRDHGAYVEGCRAVERLFTIRGGDRLETDALQAPYTARRPRLLTGTQDQPSLGLHAMRSAFDLVASKVGAEILSTRARRVASTENLCTIETDDGRRLRAKRVLLAGGVLGNAQLILRSFDDLSGFRFSDHTPWMLFTTGLRGLGRTRTKDHFNVASIERSDGTECTAFVSVYDMAHADLNLLLASVTGRTWAKFRGWMAPPGVSLINPVQVWTPATFDLIEVEKHAAELTIRSRPRAGHGPDRIHSDTIAMLKAAGARILKSNKSQPGLGFHYHNLQFASPGCASKDVATTLRERSGDRVACVDGGALSRIGCRPHTLTVMARAREIGRALTRHI